MHYDVIVVGAGPAGSISALKLAGAGVKTLLLEKEELPRYKTCGGGLVARAYNMIPAGLDGNIERACRRAVFYTRTGDGGVAAESGEPFIYMTMRSGLDAFLADEAGKAGADLRTKIKVEEVSGSGPYEVRTRDDVYTCDYVIAADGVFSRTALSAGWRPQKDLVAALEAEIFVEDKVLAGFSEEARFDFGAIPKGYGWVFPKKDHLSIGVGAVKAPGRNLGYYLENYLSKLGIDKTLQISKRGHAIPSGPRSEGCARGGILLAGDAAGFADPVTFEGITFALKSGGLAAEAVLEAKNSRSAAHIYSDKIKEWILPEIRYGKFLSALLYKSEFTAEIILNAYGQRFANVMRKLISGDFTYRGLLRDPKNYLKLFANKKGNGRPLPSRKIKT